MKLKHVWKMTVLVTASAVIIVAVSILGFLVFGYCSSDRGRHLNTPVVMISNSLTREENTYSFTGEALLGENRWAMLLNQEGQVVWSHRKPEDVPETYSLMDVASFTRWYLEDYPVVCRVREDGLLVVGSPKGSMWKHDIYMRTEALLQMPFWFLGCFLVALVCVLGFAYLSVRRWFRKDQQVRDAARSNWINGVSHDIRTPLSVLMGYAAQLEGTADLPPEQQRQASAIRAQSQVIRDLVNDLNLTMRLDCEMQALRKEKLQPEVFLRQIGADFLNGGMAEGYDFEIDLPEMPLPELEADPFLLRRTLNNLLTNCVRHNAPGCPIRLGAKARKRKLILFVEGGAAGAQTAPHNPQEQDGGATHGTGLKLVAQIAAAHGGKARFYNGTPYRCELIFPVKN